MKAENARLEERRLNLYAAEMQHQRCVAVEILVNKYVPACFWLDTLVLDCNWQGRASSSGGQVRDMMLKATKNWSGWYEGPPT